MYRQAFLCHPGSLAYDHHYLNTFSWKHWLTGFGLVGSLVGIHFSCVDGVEVHHLASRRAYTTC